MYELRYLKTAEWYFKKIWEKSHARALQEALTAIATDPYAGERRKGDLSGIFCHGFYYGKAYQEIAYRIYEEDGRLVVVILAGTRENFYAELKQYMR